MAKSCESWLNLSDVIDVVRFPIDLSGLGIPVADDETAWES